MKPIDVAQAYFERMRAHDRSVVDLFADDAVLVGLGARVEGRAKIAEFYGGAISGAAPVPREPEVIVADGLHVAAEIYIDLTDGTTLHVVDLFEVLDGRIVSLKYFIGNDPPASLDDSLRFG